MGTVAPDRPLRVEVITLEGFFKSVVRRLHRYPAFIVEGRKYVGKDFVKVDALISASLAAQRVGS